MGQVLCVVQIHVFDIELDHQWEQTILSCHDDEQGGKDSFTSSCLSLLEAGQTAQGYPRRTQI